MTRKIKKLCLLIIITIGVLSSFVISTNALNNQPPNISQLPLKATYQGMDLNYCLIYCQSNYKATYFYSKPLYNGTDTIYRTSYPYTSVTWIFNGTAWLYLNTSIGTEELQIETGSLSHSNFDLKNLSNVTILPKNLNVQPLASLIGFSNDNINFDITSTTLNILPKAVKFNVTGIQTSSATIMIFDKIKYPIGSPTADKMYAIIDTPVIGNTATFTISPLYATTYQYYLMDENNSSLLDGIFTCSNTAPYARFRSFPAIKDSSITLVLNIPIEIKNHTEEYDLYINGNKKRTYIGDTDETYYVKSTEVNLGKNIYELKQGNTIVDTFSYKLLPDSEGNIIPNFEEDPDINQDNIDNANFDPFTPSTWLNPIKNIFKNIMQPFTFMFDIIKPLFTFLPPELMTLVTFSFAVGIFLRFFGR